ncbi:MAG TPA: glutamate racemase [Xanthobacteraceae bacterium]|jgi:glutamate racemase
MVQSEADRVHALKALVFDSGLGGLTVLRELARARPDLELVYASDDAAFPYGRLGDGELVERVCKVMEQLIAEVKPDLVVIACNTASTLALPVLRARFSIPFVGTVPAIKPACERSKTKRVSVLATPRTVRRDYTHDLIREFAGDCKVTLVGSELLASLAESALRGEAVTDEAIAAEIAPCFVDDGARTDTVVLACTHYPLLLDRLKKLAPWPVEWIDPAPAIARRASSLLGAPGPAANVPVRALFTSGQAPSTALAGVLAVYGVGAAEALPAAV